MSQQAIKRLVAFELDSVREYDRAEMREFLERYLPRSLPYTELKDKLDNITVNHSQPSLDGSLPQTQRYNP
jgi:hypothetical protein